MSEIERDHLLRRVVQTLRQLPAVETDEIRRVVEAAAAQRLMPAADEPTDDVPMFGRLDRGRRPWMYLGFGAMVAAAAIVGFFVRGTLNRPTSTPPLASNTSSTAAPIRAAVNSEQDVLPIPQQFVFRSASARSVSVVGDFNGWSAARTPMAREAGGDLWSVTIPIAPGRHVYGFMVDSTFTLDPDARVARAKDPDLGVEGSVLIVGRP